MDWILDNTKKSLFNYSIVIMHFQKNCCILEIHTETFVCYIEIIESC
jgi:hypothetical protein